MTADLDAIRAREAAATPGPWGWYGNSDVHDVYLASRDFGRQFVMQFARWGMSGAQPVFCVGRTWTSDPKNMGDFDFTVSGGMTKARDLPIYEVAPEATSRADRGVYRADLAGIRHPDAEFIAHAREDIRVLLAEIDRLGGGVR